MLFSCIPFCLNPASLVTLLLCVIFPAKEANEMQENIKHDTEYVKNIVTTDPKLPKQGN